MRFPNPRDYSHLHYDLAIILHYRKKWYGGILAFVFRRLNPDFWWAYHGWIWRRFPKWLRMWRWPKSNAKQKEELLGDINYLKLRIMHLETKLWEANLLNQRNVVK